MVRSRKNAGTIKVDALEGKPTFPRFRGCVTESVHQCSLCAKSFKKSRALRMHQLSVHPKSKPDTGSKQLTISPPSHGSVRFHAESTSYECSLCAKSFKKSRALSMHQRRVHSEDIDHTDGSSVGDKPLTIPSQLQQSSSSDLVLCLPRLESVDAKKLCQVVHASKLPDAAQTDASKGKPIFSQSHGHVGVLAHKCSVCGKRFKQLKALQLHQMRAHPKNRRDVESKQLTTTAPQLQRHVGFRTGLTWYYCSQCTKCFKQLKGLRVHQLDAHSEDGPHMGGSSSSTLSSQSCVNSTSDLILCLPRLETGTGVKTCQVVHSAKKPDDAVMDDQGEKPTSSQLLGCPRVPVYKCSLCSKSFKKRTALCMHQMRVHSEDIDHMDESSVGDKQLTIAPQLQQSSSSDLVLCLPRLESVAAKKRCEVVHTSKLPDAAKTDAFKGKPTSSQSHGHVGVLAHKCSVCGKGFKQVKALQLHQMRAHPRNRRDVESKQLTTTVPQLQRHVGFRTGLTWYYCSQCTKCFKQLNGLRMHQLGAHSEDGPHVDGSSSSTLSSLSPQSRVNSTSDLILCLPRLETGTGEKTCQVVHAAKKPDDAVMDDQGEKPSSSQLLGCPRIPAYKCYLCTKSFKKQNALRMHQMRVHSEERPDGNESTFSSQLHSVSSSSLLLRVPRLESISAKKPYEMVSARKDTGVAQTDAPSGKPTSCDPVSLNVQTYKCSLCNKSFEQSVALHMHQMRAHSKDRRDTGSEQLKASSPSQRRVRFRVGLMSYHCSVCNKTFKKLRGLHMHQIRVHT